MTDCLLINPGGQQAIFQGLAATATALEPPIWARLIASYLRLKKLPAHILDAEALGLAPHAVAHLAEGYKPRLITIVVHGSQPQASSQKMPATTDTVKALKEAMPDVPVLLVGGHIAALPLQSLQETGADYVCTGEGPATVYELTWRLKNDRSAWWATKGLMWLENGKPCKTPYAPNVQDLDGEMPGGCWDLLPMKSYRSYAHHGWTNGGERQPYASIYTSQNCPYACFTGDTYFLLPDRIIAPNRLNFDKQFQCHGHKHSLSAEDDRVVYQGDRSCIKLFLSNGLSISLTPNHELFVPNENCLVGKCAGDISVGDWVALEIGQNSVERPVFLPESQYVIPKVGNQANRDRVTLPKYFNRELAWLTGMLISDGFLPAEKTRWAMHFAVIEKVRCRLAQAIKNLFNLELQLKVAGNTEKMLHGWVYSKSVIEFFKQCVGVDAQDKLRVPDVVFRSPPDVVREFLNGVYDGDGYWGAPHAPYLATFSERLAIEISHLIHWIGDAAVIRHYKKCYRVEWHSADCRNRIIGTPCPLSRIPVPFAIGRDNKGKLFRRSPKGNNRWGVTRGLLKQFNPIHQLVQDKFIYARVVSISDIGRHPVFDVHNHPTHKVSASGVFAKNCSFCMISAPFQKGDELKLNGKRANIYRTWSADSVIKEIETLVEDYGVTNIRFNDEMFILNESHVGAICDKIIERYGSALNLWCYGRADQTKEKFLAKMRAAGFKWICLGIEAASDDVRDGVDKGEYGVNEIIDTVARIKAHDINIVGNFIVGLPSDTHESMQQTLDLALELMPEYFNLYACVAMPGSPLWTDKIAAGWQPPKNWLAWSFHSYEHEPLGTNTLTPAEVLAFRDRAYQRYMRDAGYLDMVRRKFGKAVADSVIATADVKLSRRLLEGIV